MPNKRSPLDLQRRAELAAVASGGIFPTLPWRPPRDGIQMQAAGIAWDGVSAPAYLADRALPLLGNRQGAVIRDPYGHRVYWLVPAGSTKQDVWERIESIDVYGPTCWVEIPPQSRTKGLGPYWLLEPRGEDFTTDPQLLHDALADVVRDAFGPRSSGASA